MVVKKIKLDFSKVEERSGWNTGHIPEGVHEMKVVDVEMTAAPDGTDMLVYAMVPTAGKYRTRRFPFYCKLQQNQLWKLRDLIVAAGGTVPKKLSMIDPNVPVGKLIAAEVADNEFNGRVGSQVQGAYNTDILDGTSSTEEDDEDEVEEDESEEDYDEDDVETDEDDEEGEDEDDAELREELEALGLPALRTRAKEYDIDTAGLKKADLVEAILEEELAEDEDDEGEEDDDEEELDEDDLTDEDLEDDDEDEEEEEPAPAPRRKAAPAKKPAAKAPAKAAAPARRVVKRR